MQQHLDMEKSFFTKIFSKKFIYQKCLDIKYILRQTDEPENYEIIHQECQIKNWKNEFPNRDLLLLWINCAHFIINQIKNSIDKSVLDDFFIGVAFSFYYPSDDWPLIPGIYVADRNRRSQILDHFCGEKINHDSSEMVKVKLGFKACGILNDFIFYKSIFKDPTGDGEISWIYCIPNL